MNQEAVSRLGEGSRYGGDSMEELVEQAIAMLGQYRFGMELHPVDRVRNVLHRHDLAVFRPRGDSERRRHRCRGNNQ